MIISPKKKRFPLAEADSEKRGKYNLRKKSRPTLKGPIKSSPNGKSKTTRGRKYWKKKGGTKEQKDGTEQGTNDQTR